MSNKPNHSVNNWTVVITYSNMFKILPKFVRPSHDFSLSNPLFKIFNVVTEFVQFQHFPKFVTSFQGQVFEAGIELVDLWLFDGDRIATLEQTINTTRIHIIRTKDHVMLVQLQHSRLSVLQRQNWTLICWPLWDEHTLYSNIVTYHINWPAVNGT